MLLAAPCSALAILVTPPRAERAAIFKAAGFTPTAGEYLMCDKRDPARPRSARHQWRRARSTRSSPTAALECYGSTGTGFVAPHPLGDGQVDQRLRQPGHSQFPQDPRQWLARALRSAAPASASPSCAGPERPSPTIASIMKASTPCSALGSGHRIPGLPRRPGCGASLRVGTLELDLDCAAARPRRRRDEQPRERRRRRARSPAPTTTSDRKWLRLGNCAAPTATEAAATGTSARG